MARKDRAPTPPRRVQAPKQRKSAPSADAAHRTRMIFYGAAAAGLVGLALVFAVIALGGGGGGSSADDAKQTLVDAGCTLQNVPGVANASDHSDVPTPETKLTWNTDPPSNGPHYQTTVIYGAYDEPVQQQLLVHNYEHGGVGIQYGSDVPAATVQQLRDYYNDDPDGLVLAPYPKLGDKIALTAWTAEPEESGKKGTGHVAKCTAFDKGAFEAFLEAFGFQGPEPFPRDALQPGSN
jgi:Protein of unknown function (DUF3105)